MICLKKMGHKGSSVIEFTLVFLGFVICLLGVVKVAVWVTAGQTLHYTAYKGARAVSVYETEGAKMEMEALVPKIEEMSLDQKEFYIKRPVWNLPIVTHAPVYFSLEGIDLDLDKQGDPSPDFKKISLMDNPISFCGKQGDYGLCAR